MATMIRSDQAISPIPQVAVPDTPYRGLEPFRFTDSHIFFARKKEVRKLLRYITMYRAVLFYGDSGAGKSSLINAGLIPEILKEGFIPDRIRVQPRANEEIIIERIPRSSNGAGGFLPSNFSDDLSGSPARMVLPVADLKKKLEALDPKKYPLLIFDQFEELVTLFEESPPQNEAATALALETSILDVLVDLISSHTLRVKLLFVFREDYLAKLNKLLIRVPDLADHYQRLTSPPKEDVGLIVRGPFDTFPDHFRNELSAELAQALKKQIEEGSDSLSINLSELQVACLKLWQSKDPDTLLSQRKIQGILEDFLSESLNTLSSDLRDPALALLRKMVTSSGTRNVISEEDLIQLVRTEDKFSPDHLRRALESLVEQTKLLRRERRQDVITYQIVSEFLVPWIKQQKAEQQARLLRRRAYRMILASLVVAAIMAAVAFGIWRFRTQQVLKDQTVQALEAKAALADNERAAALAERDRAIDDNRKLREAVAKGDKNLIDATLSKQIDSANSDLVKARAETAQLKSQLADIEQKTASKEKAMDVLYNQLDKQDQDLKNEIQRMKSNEQSDVLRRELGDAKDQLIKKDQEIARLKAKIDELQSKPGQPPVTIGGTPTKPETGETLVFKTGKSIGEGGKLALAGEPFKGLLTVRLGDVTGDNIPVEILDTNDPSKKIASQKFKRKSNFSLPFTYQGVNYVLRGSIAGVINRSLTFQIVRQGSQ